MTLQETKNFVRSKHKEANAMRKHNGSEVEYEIHTHWTGPAAIIGAGNTEAEARADAMNNLKGMKE